MGGLRGLKYCPILESLIVLAGETARGLPAAESSKIHGLCSVSKCTASVGGFGR